MTIYKQKIIDEFVPPYFKNKNEVISNMISSKSNILEIFNQIAFYYTWSAHNYKSIILSWLKDEVINKWDDLDLVISSIVNGDIIDKGIQADKEGLYTGDWFIYQIKNMFIRIDIPFKGYPHGNLFVYEVKKITQWAIIK